MAFLLPSALRASTSRSIAASPHFRYSTRNFITTSHSNAESPSSTTSSLSAEAPREAPFFAFPPRTGAFPDLDTPLDFRNAPPQVSATAWWTNASRNHVGIPNTPFSGRSFQSTRFNDFNQQYRKMQRLIRSTGLKDYIKRSEYHEKGSVKRVRLNSERHRRRFAANVSDW
jgi:ribosomal protein S21